MELQLSVYQPPNAGNFVLLPVSDASGLDPTSPLDILSNAEPLRRMLEGCTMELQLSVYQPPNVIMDTEELELRARMQLGWAKCDTFNSIFQEFTQKLSHKLYTTLSENWDAASDC